MLGELAAPFHSPSHLGLYPKPNDKQSLTLTELISLPHSLSFIPYQMG